MTNSCVEIELINGHRMLIDNDWSKVYSIEEKIKKSFKLISSFPFVEVENKKYVTFMYRTKSEYLNSEDDPVYNVNCSISQLAKLFGVKVTEFEKAMIEHDIESYE